MTLPDSGEREVCHTECRIEGVMHVCNRPRGHAPPHVLELFKRATAREPVGFGDTAIPLSLAQRILAALETGMAGTIAEAQKQIALADELRAVVERKP